MKEFIARTTSLLSDYDKRIESMESFVYLHCVCIQVEKHFSQRRNDALQGKEQNIHLDHAHILLVISKHI